MRNEVAKKKISEKVSELCELFAEVITSSEIEDDDMDSMLDIVAGEKFKMKMMSVLKK